MSDYGVTDKGFQMRRLDEIYTDICKRFKDEVGVDPSENPQSVMNVLFTIFADAPAELWEAYAAAYQQLFPNTACGVALDNVMQVGGVSRMYSICSYQHWCGKSQESPLRKRLRWTICH